MGGGLLPPWLPLNPMSTDAPGSSVPFQAAFSAVTCAPVCDQVADQPCVTCCPAGKENSSRQESIVVEPELVMLTLAVKPSAQSLVR